MSWVAVAVGVGSAAVGAYGAKQSSKAAKEANKAANRTQSTDQTTTTKQEGWAPVQDDLLGALDLTNQQFAKGAPKKKGGGGGTDKRSKAVADELVKRAMAPNPNLGAANDFVGGVLGKPAAAADARKGFSAMTEADLPAWARGKLSVADYQAQLRGNANMPGNKMFRDDAGAPAGSAPANPANVFGDYNPVYEDLYNRVDNASFDRSAGLLEEFLSAGGGAGAPAPGAGTAAEPIRRSGGNVIYRPQAAERAAAAGVGGLGSGLPPGTAAPQMISDQNVAPGLFNDEARKVLAGDYLDPEDPMMQDWLDQIEREMREDLDHQLQDVGDEFEGANMYGGSGLALERSRTREEGMEAMGAEKARNILALREAERGRMQDTLGQVGQRDIAGSGIASNERIAAADFANREKIANANASAAGAGAAAGLEDARLNREAQLQLANRGMNLDAIKLLMGQDQFGLSTIGELGGALSRDRFTGIDAMTPLDDLSRSGLLDAFGVSNAVGGQDAAAAGRRADTNFQNQLLESAHLDDYLRRLGFFAGQGGTTTQNTVGENVVPPTPYMGPSPASAGLTAGLGAGLAVYGARR